MPYNYFFSGEVFFEQRCFGPNFPPMKNKYLKAFCQLQTFRRQLKMIPNATNFVLKVKFWGKIIFVDESIPIKLQLP